jgi:drug/metabolite transporter (DMT)-like permease
MSLVSIALLFVASFLHSVWNLLAKKSGDKQIFLVLAVLSGALMLTPFALARAQTISATAWFVIVGSAIFESLYYLLLGGAYSRGDLSLIYPLSRGSSPIFIVLIGVFILRESVSWLGAFGVALIVVGIYVLHLRAFNRDHLLAPFVSLKSRASQFALLSGFAVAAYSAFDKIGVTLLNPVFYFWLALGLSVLFLAPMLAAKRNAVALEIKNNAPSILAVAVIITFGYLLILFVLQNNKASYATSIRGVSVVFGALMGAVVLKEEMTPPKILGGLIIFAGIVCIGLA